MDLSDAATANAEFSEIPIIPAASFSVISGSEPSSETRRSSLSDSFGTVPTLLSC